MTCWPSLVSIFRIKLVAGCELNYFVKKAWFSYYISNSGASPPKRRGRKPHTYRNWRNITKPGIETMKPKRFIFHYHHAKQYSSRASVATTTVSRQYGDISHAFDIREVECLAPQRDSEARNKATKRRGTWLVQFGISWSEHTCLSWLFPTVHKQNRPLLSLQALWACQKRRATNVQTS